ncbi:Thioesterase superfamily protein [Actibacterium lipolyticum]|uniref:Medium/long-chain acyl-CoA thioesterase YigI n=2 Tax=Actibacterium lipolyticum TaxID=1524263 RepID=A0A238KPB9_9RHOB|nr:Thioesterase superfamily protein [Actibacterium lipolyticum]
MALIGPLLRSTKMEERNTYGLQTTEQHKNHIGLVHGGVLTSLMDQVLAIVAWNAADRQPTVTVQMDTRFLGAAKAGDFLEARASIRHATRSLIFIDAAISSVKGPVASASAIMKISLQAEQKK